MNDWNDVIYDYNNPDMNSDLKVNDKITWKDKYGRLLPGIVTSLDKYDDVPELDLNGCICISAPT